MQNHYNNCCPSRNISSTLQTHSNIPFHLFVFSSCADNVEKNNQMKTKKSLAFHSLDQFREQKAEHAGYHWDSDDLQV